MFKRIAAAATISAIGLAAGNVNAAEVSVNVLPERWRMADWGVPVDYQGETLYFYADLVTTDTAGKDWIARSMMTLNGLEFIHPIDVPGQESFYWVTDATELPDGSLLVASLEVENTDPATAEAGWAFAVVDTDMFIVEDALAPASWAAASVSGKIEDGWWRDGDQIEFSDQYPGLAFAMNSYCALENDCRSRVVEFDVTDPTVGDTVAHTPESSGQFAPVQTADGWVGVAWDWDANTATYWTTDMIGDPWVEGETVVYGDGQTHAHGLNVVNGEVVHRWSTIGQRPSSEPVTP